MLSISMTVVELPHELLRDYSTLQFPHIEETLLSFYESKHKPRCFTFYS